MASITPAGIPNFFSEVFSRFMARYANVNLQFVKHGQRVPIGKNGGQTVRITALPPKAPSITAITDPESVSGFISTSIEDVAVTMTPQLYGQADKWSRSALYQSNVSELLEREMKRIVECCKRSADLVVANAIIGSENSHGCLWKGKANDGSISDLEETGTELQDVTGTVSLTDFIELRRALVLSRALPYRDGTYHALIPTTLATTLRKSTSTGDPADLSKHTEAGRRYLETGEIGTWFGIKFFETPNIDLGVLGGQLEGAGEGPSSADLYPCVLTGEEAWACGTFSALDGYKYEDADSYEPIFLDQPDKSDDPFNQLILIGYKGWWGAVVKQYDDNGTNHCMVYWAQS